MNNENLFHFVGGVSANLFERLPLFGESKDLVMQPIILTCIDRNLSANLASKEPLEPPAAGGGGGAPLDC